MFFDQFAGFLEHVDSLPGKTVLLGDFNIHFEKPENSNTQKLQNITKMFSFTQSVTEPTHCKGHMLDLIFYKLEDRIHVSTKVDHALTSDHSAVQ